MESYLFLGALVVLGVWLCKLLWLHITVYTFKPFWDKQAKKPAQQDELIYFVLGDSTAQGIGAMRAKQSYPYLVAMWLQKQSARPVRIINFSVAGAKLQDVFTDQLPKLSQYSPPHIVTISIGSNNMKDFNAESYEVQFKQIIMALPKESYVANVPSFGGPWQKLDWKAQQAGELMGRHLKTTNHHLVDMYSATKAFGSYLDFAADTFHPNARAYKKWALTFEKVMAERIPELIVVKN